MPNIEWGKDWSHDVFFKCWNAWNAMAVARYSPKESHLRERIWIGQILDTLKEKFQRIKTETSSVPPWGTAQRAWEQNLRHQFQGVALQPAGARLRASSGSKIIFLKHMLFNINKHKSIACLTHVVKRKYFCNKGLPWLRFQAQGWGIGQSGSPCTMIKNNGCFCKD